MTLNAAASWGRSAGAGSRKAWHGITRSLSCSRRTKRPWATAPRARWRTLSTARFECTRMSRAGAIGAGVAVHSHNPGVMLLGPKRTAVSGVATHLNQLFDSGLSRQFRLSQFQVGREGRSHNGVAVVARILGGPFAFAACLLRSRAQIVHINTSFDPKAYWRDLVYLVLSKAMRRKVVYQVHGGALPGEFFPRSRALSALLRRTLSWPDIVVVLAYSELAAYRAF